LLAVKERIIYAAIRSDYKCDIAIESIAIDVNAIENSRPSPPEEGFSFDIYDS
jgi:hypothetical protein